MIIKMTLDRFENDKAVLISSDSQSVIWPKDKLPANLNEGAVLMFEILTDKDLENKDRHIAKDILNEMLKINS